MVELLAMPGDFFDPTPNSRSFDSFHKLLMN
jgi:hypothetical protein